MAMTKENNAILPKDIKKRIYKSRKQRPCDNCRKRKSCCIIENGIPCKLCKMFNKKCTFEKGPVYNSKPVDPTKKKSIVQNNLINNINNKSISTTQVAGPQGSIEIKQEYNQNDELNVFSATRSSSAISYTSTKISENHVNSNNNNDYLFQYDDKLYNYGNSLNGGDHIGEEFSDFNYPSVNDWNNGMENMGNMGIGMGMLDLDLNMDSLNFQAGLFDFSLEFEQMR